MVVHLQAADQGYALAQLALGGFYEWGRRVPTNFIDLAIQWLKKAAAQDNAEGECPARAVVFQRRAKGT